MVERLSGHKRFAYVHLEKSERSEVAAMADMLDDNGVLVASHLARTLHGSHEETSKILKEINMLTAYDGMKLVF